VSSSAQQSKLSLNEPPRTRTAPPRSFDRYDCLVLALATMIGAVVVKASPAVTPPHLDFVRKVDRLYHSVLPEPALPALPVLTSPGLPSSPMSGAAAPNLLAAAPLDGDDVLAQWVNRFRPLLFAWTLALFFLRLRAPSPPRRALTRQPGLIASAVAILVLSVEFCAILVRWAVTWSWTALGPAESPGGQSFRAAALFHMSLLDLWQSVSVGFLESTSAAHGIAGAWLIMALGGWWRPERTAIDRLGRAIGLAWIAIMVADLINPFV
jgi:hypothetical protein